MNNQFIVKISLCAVSIMATYGRAESYESRMLRGDVSRIADSLEGIQRQNFYTSLNTVNSLNDIAQQIQLQTFSNTMLGFAQMATMNAAANAEAIRAARQEEWNSWNGLVSLLNPEQKQIVLAFNQTNDDDLVNLYLALRKSTNTLPVSFLMPDKRASLTNNIVIYCTEKAPPEEYIGLLNELNDGSAKELWNDTTDDQKKRLGLWLGTISADAYIRYTQKLWYTLRQSIWMRVPKGKRKEIANYLRKKHENFEIETFEDYIPYMNYVTSYWQHSSAVSGWKSYQKDKLRTLSKKSS